MADLWNLAMQYSHLLVIGFKVTILISVVAICLGFLLGVVICFMRISKNTVLSTIAFGYVELIRGTPILLQIAMVYYGLPLIGVNIPSFEIGGFTFDRFLCGVLALMINSSAYISEIIRSGIQSIDKGQEEAALSLGFTKREAMALVIFPAAIKNVIPALGNNFITMVKSSSQVSTIGLADLMYTANVIRGNSFRPFSPLVMVAILYLFLTLSLSALLRKVEHRLNISNARA